MTQCKIRDIDNDVIHGAILFDNGDAICGCCGGLLEADELDESWEILEKYDYWVDLSDAIIGE